MTPTGIKPATFQLVVQYPWYWQYSGQFQ